MNYTWSSVEDSAAGALHIVEETTPATIENTPLEKVYILYTLCNNNNNYSNNNNNNNNNNDYNL